VLTNAVSQVHVLVELLKSGADIRATPDLRACIRGHVIPEVVAILMDLKSGQMSKAKAILELEPYAQACSRAAA
jgi:hypothetical protein